MRTYNGSHFLFIIFFSHLAFNGCAFNYISRNSGRPQHNQDLRVRGQYLLINTKNSVTVYSTTYSSTQSSYMKLKDGRTNQNNSESVIYFKKNQTVENTAHSRDKRHISFISRYILHSTTPSSLEFYYSVLNEDPAQFKKIYLDRFNEFTTNPPKPLLHSSYSFRNGPYVKRILVTSRKPNAIVKRYQKIPTCPDVQPVNRSNVEKVYKLIKKITLADFDNDRTEFGPKFKTENVYFTDSKMLKTKRDAEQQTALKLQLLSTIPAVIPDDRVKFFEIYDKNTFPPPINNHMDLRKSMDTESQSHNIIPEIMSLGDVNSHVNRRHCNNDSYKTGKKTKIESRIQKSNVSKILDNNGTLRNDNALFILVNSGVTTKAKLIGPVTLLRLTYIIRHR